MGRSLNGRGSQKTCLAILQLDFRVSTEPVDRYQGLRKLGAALQANMLEGLFYLGFLKGGATKHQLKRRKIIATDVTHSERR
jgi:hypothetical protein